MQLRNSLILQLSVTQNNNKHHFFKLSHIFFMRSPPEKVAFITPASSFFMSTHNKLHSSLNQSNMFFEFVKLQRSFASLNVYVLQGVGGGVSKVAATQDGGVRQRGQGFKPCPRKPI